MECREVRLFMRLWAQGELNEQIAQEIDRHMWISDGGCDACQFDYETRFPVTIKADSFWEEDGSWSWNALQRASAQGVEEASKLVSRLGSAVAVYSRTLRQKAAVRSRKRGAEVSQMPEVVRRSTSLRARKGTLNATVQVVNPKQLPAQLVVKIDPGDGERPISWGTLVEDRGTIDVVIPGFPADLLSLDWPHVDLSMRYAD